MTGPTRQFNGLIAAGATVQVALSGTNFYLTASTAPLYMRPRGGLWVYYYVGTEGRLDQGFDLVEVQNPTTNPVTFQLLVGYDSFVDHRLFPNSPTQNVVHVPQPNAQGQVIAVDLSGLAFNDPAGTPWLAISRLSVTVQVAALGTGDALAIVAGGLGSGGNQILKLTAPGGPFTYPVAGRVNANATGDNTENDVWYFWEIYSAIPPQSLAYPSPG
jgi:hypothetical protein